MKFSRIGFSRLWSTAALVATLTLAACQGDFANRADAPIPPQTVALMSEKGVDPESPTLIRAYKKESELEIWKMRPDGRYVHLKTFPMCRWSGQLGPKTREGDRQVPEGFYSITPGQMNPNSNYYLSFNVGYPNQLDRALGHTGGTIMVHGACSSAGCFSMTDAQIAEIYAIARTSFGGGQRAIQMQSFPFRMTPENLAKHRLDQNMAFWKQLKEGNDHFEVTQKEPRVAFCGRRYVFNATPGEGQNMDANGACPPLKRNPDIALAVAEKSDQDNRKVAELADIAGLWPLGRVTAAVYAVLPHTEDLDNLVDRQLMRDYAVSGPFRALMESDDFSWESGVGLSLLHTVAYLGLACAIFSRRDP